MIWPPPHPEIQLAPEVNQLRVLVATLSAILVGCVTYTTHEPETRSVEVPAGFSEADVLSKYGAPAYVSRKDDGGKLLVFEKTETSTTSSTTTPLRNPRCQTVCDTKTGKCQKYNCEPIYVTSPGQTSTSKSVTVIDIAPNGAVLSIKVTE